MATSELAQKYITDHTSPIIKKIELFGLKQHLLPVSEAGASRQEKCHEKIAKSLRQNRVDRRLARSIAEWIPEERSAKITKITSATAAFGIQNKSGKFLNADEALYLLEINKLELFCKDVSVSIEEAFKNIESLEKYQAYKQLWLQGYKLKRGNKCQNDLKNEGIGEPPRKIARIETNADNYMTDVFENLRRSGPKTFSSEGFCSQQPDYRLCVNPGKEKCCNVIVESGKEFSSKIDDENVNIYALSSDDVAFYRFYNTEISIL